MQALISLEQHGKRITSTAVLCTLKAPPSVSVVPTLPSSSSVLPGTLIFHCRSEFRSTMKIKGRSPVRGGVVTEEIPKRQLQYPVINVLRLAPWANNMWRLRIAWKKAFGREEEKPGLTSSFNNGTETGKHPEPDHETFSSFSTLV